MRMNFVSLLIIIIDDNSLQSFFLLVRLMEDWTSPIYAFFFTVPDITYNAKGRRAHEFRCAARVCKCKGVNGRMVRRYLDMTD